MEGIGITKRKVKIDDKPFTLEYSVAARREEIAFRARRLKELAKSKLKERRRHGE